MGSEMCIRDRYMYHDSLRTYKLLSLLLVSSDVSFGSSLPRPHIRNSTQYTSSRMNELSQPASLSELCIELMQRFVGGVGDLTCLEYFATQWLL